MDCKNFNCRECKNPKCNRMATGGDYCTACQHIYDALEAENRTLREAGKYLISFIPAWAKEVPEGLCPTFYGTCSADGDKKVKAKVDRIVELLKEES